MRITRKILLFFIFLSITAVLLAEHSQVDNFQSKITKFKLKNGMSFIIMERHNIPVVSFVTYVDTGSVNEVKGITGIAHVFEHMAFKGTTEIGTKNYKKEKIILQKMDKIFAQIVFERKKIEGPNKNKLSHLEAKLKELQSEAEKYVVNNEFVHIVETNGGVGTNAATSADATQYFINLPSNKIELWAWLESERILHPVLREFFKEKSVIEEERRMRTENNPIGRLIEELQCTAFKAHPYGEPIIGHMSDIKNESRPQAWQFHRKYYVGKNITISIVGDVYPDKIKPILKKYFSPVPAGQKAARITTVEPPQVGEKRITIRDKSQPVIVIAYHKPDIRDKDSAVYDAIQDILAGGKASRLYKKMVKEDKSALFVGAFPGFPGTKYPNLFLFFAVPNTGHTPEELEKSITDELEKLKSNPVSDEELKAVQKKAEVRLYNELLSNSGMAAQLAYYDVVTGDWRNLFKQVNKIRAVTPQDIMRVSRKCFVFSNKTVGMIVHEKENKRKVGSK